MKDTCKCKQTTKNIHVDKALWKHYTIEIWSPQFDVKAGKFSNYNASILSLNGSYW